MSIIENAAKRLEHTRRHAPPPPAEDVAVHGEPPAAVPPPPAAHMAAAPASGAAAHRGGAPDLIDAGTPPSGTASAPGSAAPAAAPAPEPSPAGPLPIRLAAPARAGADTLPRPKRYAEIDLARLRSLGMVASDGERSLVADEFRLVKRPLLRRAAGPREDDRTAPANLLMVTSSLPREGKTYTAINLAMSIAMERDHTVLLVDADVARPSVFRTLGVQADIGLTDLLDDDALDVADAIVHTNVPSLSLIGAGRHTRYTTELLASRSMVRLLAGIARRYPDRIVIFDSPPVLATTEAQALAHHMGQIVMVVEAERTTQSQLKEALRLVGDARNVSLLYNKARPFASETRYGHY